MRNACVLSVVVLMLGGSAWAAEPAADKPVPRPEKPDVENPIRDISALMKKAGELLAKLETGEPTQNEQKKVLKQLDALIQLAEECSSSSSQQKPKQGDKGSESTPQQPQGSSGASSGATPVGREADVLREIRKHLGAEPPDLREMWGRLPEAARDDMMQLLNENLPLRYKTLLILYFKALSEKK